ncbi:MAG: flavin reductase family protein [Alphaproteobacteria bacterium]|nr:flavin reductase family protein [Alphaproteobacteria bacterium]
MFYEPAKNNHGLPRNPFKALVAPRPIGWITSVDENGVTNIAPYSYYNAFGDNPVCVAFSAAARPEGGMKDSSRNVEKTGEFVANLVSWDQREAMNLTSAALPPGQSEVAFAGLEMEPSTLVKPQRIKGAPAHLECKLWKIVDLPCNDPDNRQMLVIGEVVGVHIDDRFITDGFVDTARMKPVARLGYMDYAVVTETFQMHRPEV